MTPDQHASLSLTRELFVRSPVDVGAGSTLLASTAATLSCVNQPRPAHVEGAAPPDPESRRLAALVGLAQHGDSDAFAALYDHYSQAVYRFVYYRVSTRALAEDLTSETFFRALRSIRSFSWRGVNFGAWLTTIARNLIADHYKSSQTRFELSTADITRHEQPTATVEDEVLTEIGAQMLRATLRKLPAQQSECLVLRFLNGNSIQQTAVALDRSEGAVKQLQLRAVRNLAKHLPAGLR